MLQIIIPSREYYTNATGLFNTTKEQTFHIEHSLVSLSKWESKWHIPFLGKEDKTIEQTVDYVRCMTITQNAAPFTKDDMTSKILEEVTAYINAPMTATWFPPDRNKKRNPEIVTSELIYYWMIALTIPFDPCQKWHLNRLLTLIHVCNIKNGPQKKMSKKEILANNKAQNDLRKQRLQTNG